MTTTPGQPSSTRPDPIADAAKAMGVSRRRAVGRLVALGYTRECSRCGGTGRYSWNQITGDRCFGCDGLKRMLVPITPQIVAEAIARIAAGELEGYFAANRARRSIEARAIAAWQTYRTSPIAAAYERWYLARHGKIRDESSSRLDSPEWHAQTLQNAAIEHVTRARYDRALDPIEACRRIDEAHDILCRANAVWRAWRGEEATA